MKCILCSVIRKDMDVNEHGRTILYCTWAYIKVKAEHCCSAVHSHSSVFNTEHNSYYKTSVKQHLTCSLAVQIFFQFTITLMFEYNNKIK